MRGRLVVTVCAITLYLGCAHKGWVPNDIFAFHSADEKRQFEMRAKAGDGEAAKRLVDYYAFVQNDPKTALYWAKVGAAHGDKDCAKSADELAQVIKNYR